MPNVRHGLHKAVKIGKNQINFIALILLVFLCSSFVTISQKTENKIVDVFGSIPDIVYFFLPSAHLKKITARNATFLITVFSQRYMSKCIV